MPTITLTVHHGGEAEPQVFDRDLIKVGRLGSAHLRLDDPKVSRIHAVIEVAGDGKEYWLIDMGSAEGTSLNGDRIQKAKLSTGDEIRFGDTRVSVSLEAAAEAPAPAVEAPAAAVEVPRPPTPGAMPAPPVVAAEPAPAPSASYPVPAVDNRAAAAPKPDAWGTVPNNLASQNVTDTDRVLEVRLVWGDTVLDSVAASDGKEVTLGHERGVEGWGPFRKVKRCDLQIPSRGLPERSYVLASPLVKDGADYMINIPPGCDGHIQRADGSFTPMSELYEGGQGAQPGEHPGELQYHLQSAETLFVVYKTFLLQIRYVRKNVLVPPPWWETINYTWLNILLVAFFVHVALIASFLATPDVKTELTEELFKNENRFAQFKLTPEQKKKAKQNSMLNKLKGGGPAGARAAGKEGKAGRKDYKGKKQGRMAIKGDPSKKELAKSALAKMFGASTKGGARRSYLFGTGGLGGELKGALGGVTGAEVGDATGLGGLGTRGVGSGGGGLSMNSIGLGALGTHGRGGGGGSGSGYGEGAAGLGRKKSRGINISPGTPVIMGSLDKEIIRRVIKQHMSQIRYCYEKELQRSPGLFGKVGTQFTISASGTVQSVSIKNATLKNSEVHRCMQAKIRSWRFPKPKGGGIVIVKYPFIFKTSG